MGKVKKNCVICGKEYKTCFPYGATDPFRWQDVACCPEHGSMYFESVFGSYYTDALKKDDEIPTDNNDEADEKQNDELLDDAYELDDEIDDEEDLDEEDYDE